MADEDFYARVPVFDGFAEVTDPARYRPLPNDWLIGIADVVASTEAISRGRYKQVNVAGAAVIAAVTNALDGADLPFVFGGDGASFAVPGSFDQIARDALSRTAALVRDELGLELRTAAMTVGDIRRAGFDVRVAKFAASEHVHYAMFSGGGLAWAERELKAGRFAVPPAAVGERPDLSGLSCRWAEIPAQRGVVLSLITVPLGEGRDEQFRQLITEVLVLADGGGRPVPDAGPPVAVSGRGFDIENRLNRKRSLLGRLRRPLAALATLFGWAVLRFGIRVGSFDPRRYRRETAQNTDFRKYDDGLKMTLDCSPELADAIENRLAVAERAGIAAFGTYRQKGALMTCFVPSLTRSDHVHFVDGSAGGYAQAAMAMKEKLALRFPAWARRLREEKSVAGSKVLRPDFGGRQRA